jgi:hypothetical protein
VGYGRIRRSIVDQDDLSVGIRLPAQSTEASLQQPLTIPIYDYETNFVYKGSRSSRLWAALIEGIPMEDSQTTRRFTETDLLLE